MDSVSGEEQVGEDPTVTLVAEALGPQAWFKATAKRLEDLLRLPPNWNSYGAKPVSPRAALAVLDVLRMTARAGTPAPQIVPTRSGGVQLEWHLRGIDAELEIDAAGRRFDLSWEDETGAEHEEKDALDRIGPIQSLVDRLSRA